MNVIEKLRAWMESTGTRQTDIVAATGFSKGHVSEVLSGKTRAGLEFAFALERMTKRKIRAAEWLNGATQ